MQLLQSFLSSPISGHSHDFLGKVQAGLTIPVFSTKALRSHGHKSQEAEGPQTKLGHLTLNPMILDQDYLSVSLLAHSSIHHPFTHLPICVSFHPCTANLLTFIGLFLGYLFNSLIYFLYSCIMILSL